ncbi:hypothetical protein KC19_2G098600 [Ceratodon purpureus]|uniref:O-fucosyltransferase family protein n=1 Tax=Ceratodon purpureus TaxID=3225 RepID=A0A8T0IS31_CERPU|nr:hypothetical protein KC19_2G098600 [Ceratodon purpureus]
MDESNGDPSLPSTAGDGERQSSPVRESRLAALRREDSVLQGGYSSSGRTSPTLLQRSNSIQNPDKSQWSSSQQVGVSSPTTRSRSFRAQGSPSSSRSDLLSWSHSPRALSPEALHPELRRGSPRFRSTSGRLAFQQFTRVATFSKRGRGRLKRSGTLFFIVLFLWFALDWWYLSSLQQAVPQTLKNMESLHADIVREDTRKDRPSDVVYGRLMALAAHGLAENEFKPEPDDLWEEPTENATTWLPCATQRSEEHTLPPLPDDTTGYIMINANGGLSQQRVAICNAVAVARILNASLVLPKFLFNNVWIDSSQFGDLYEVDYFIDYLKDDVRIVKELPFELQSLDLDAIEAVVTELDVPKESKPSFYLKYILPLLLKTRVVLFEGFGNRLAFDPVPFEIQRLRCRCNFHALKFVPELQKMGRLIVERMRDRHPRWGPMDDEFHDENTHWAEGEKARIRFAKTVPKYLAVHMRFEMDMVAYSLCDFGGGDAEREELRAYRAQHFPALAKLEHDGKLGSAELMRELGHCPLMPEEAFLMLAALGFKRGTRIYLAGARMYGGEAKMTRLKYLYPNIVTKEDLLTVEELQPFRNHSSQLAVLDYLASAWADAFAMTDSGSQLSSLVAGYRIYYGSGHAPTIRPNKRRLASIFESNATIEWSHFETRIRKAVKETKRIALRPVSRSIYRHPRCLECMCKHDSV